MEYYDMDNILDGVHNLQAQYILWLQEEELESLLGQATCGKEVTSVGLYPVFGKRKNKIK